MQNLGLKNISKLFIVIIITSFFYYRGDRIRNIPQIITNKGIKFTNILKAKFSVVQSRLRCTSHNIIWQSLKGKGYNFS